jgi:hypothetical protein
MECVYCAVRLSLNIIEVRSRLQCANELKSGVFKFIRLMEFSIQNASIGTPTKINLLYNILQKADNASFRRILLSFGMEAYDHTHTVYIQNIRPHALCIGIQNTRPYAHCVQKHKTLGQAHTVYRHKTLGHTHTVCRNTKHLATHTHTHTHNVCRNKTIGQAHCV